LFIAFVLFLVLLLESPSQMTEDEDEDDPPSSLNELALMSR